MKKNLLNSLLSVITTCLEQNDQSIKMDILRRQYISEKKFQIKSGLSPASHLCTMGVRWPC